MQGLCGELCRGQGIFETVEQPRTIKLSKDDVGAMAAEYARHRTDIFDKILNPDSPKSWQTKDRRMLSLAEILVLAINHRRPNEPYPLDTLVNRIKRLTRGELPTNLEATLVKKIIEIINMYGGDDETKDRSPIFWDTDAKALVVLDPYFVIWARWVVGPDLAGKLFS